MCVCVYELPPMSYLERRTAYLNIPDYTIILVMSTSGLVLVHRSYSTCLVTPILASVGMESIATSQQQCSKRYTDNIKTFYGNQQASAPHRCTNGTSLVVFE